MEPINGVNPPSPGRAFLAAKLGSVLLGGQAEVELKPSDAVCTGKIVRCEVLYQKRPKTPKNAITPSRPHAKPFLSLLRPLALLSADDVRAAN